MSVLHSLFGFTLIKTCLVFYLLILFVTVITTSAANAALCFLTMRPELEMLHFAEQVALDGLQYGVEVFVIVDDNAYKVPSPKPSNVQILQIPNEKCVAYGYQETMYVTTRPIQTGTWDRALLYFCELNTKHSFVWFVEDDVFIPSVHAFRSFHQLYARTNDLIVQRLTPNWSGGTTSWPHWPLANGKLVPPWFRSMTNAIGLSRRLLNAIADNVRWRGINTFHEFLPQTLGINLNMTVVTPIELDTLVWDEIYTWEDIENSPNQWWHPVKNWTIQKEWHRRIANESASGNSSIEWSHLTTLCNSDNNSKLLDERLSKLINAFDRSKTQLSPDERHSLRQHFLYLAEQCKKLKDSESAEIIVRNLADSAYKLPEHPTDQIITKSSTYLMIGKALAQNKQYVFQFFTNLSIVNSLRQEATNLTWELTLEIQRALDQQNNQFLREKARESRNNISSLIIYTLVASENIENRMSKIRNALSIRDRRRF